MVDIKTFKQAIRLLNQHIPEPDWIICGGCGQKVTTVIPHENNDCPVYQDFMAEQGA